jgi:general secretion pathway protein G
MIWLWRQRHPMKRARKAAQGFTLIELMWVVVILGILASVVLAAMGNPVATTKETALASTLREFRSQLRLYTMQHGDTPPADGAAVASVLLHRTDDAGNVGTGTQYPLGPYLLSFPVNPFNGRSDVKVIPAGTPLTPDGTTGWLYQVEGGNFTFVANAPGTTPGGKAIASF